VQRETTRSDAIRRLVELALNLKLVSPSKKTAACAAELAKNVVEQKLSQSLPAEEKAVRKRRILKGPSDFVAVRKDQTDEA